MNGLGASVRDAWRLAIPYFAESDERWPARGLLALVIGLNLAMVGIDVLLNGWRGAFYNAIGAKDWDGFISLLLWGHRSEDGFNLGFTILAFTYVGLSIQALYLSQLLRIRWRRWLTTKYAAAWLSDRAYYKISLIADRQDPGADNPDQRISEDIRDFCENTIQLGVELISRIVSLLSFLTILWGLSRAITIMGLSIPGYLFWVALIYASFGTVFTHLIGRPLTALVFRQQRVEADFRYGLVRVRENVEGIALYHGEKEERATLLDRFAAVVGNFRAIMTRMRLLYMVTGVYDQTSVIFPIILVAPGYFAGKFPQGVLFQTVGAFAEVQRAMSFFIRFYDDLARWRAVVDRLGTFHRSIEAAHAPNDNLVRAVSADGAVHVRGMNLSLPNGTKLLENADLTLTPGHSVVITGRSGSGKSTLFRVLSGIWPFARGEIAMPENAFFLPQRPYIPLGTLRHVITYPNDPELYGRPALAQALRDVGLENLVDRLDHDDNWPQSLSGGEQQRVAVARALLAKPTWIFLDEATASLDPESETLLYQTLRSHLPGTTLVSIAHRPSVAAFHEGRVQFDRTGSAPGRLVVEAGA